MNSWHVGKHMPRELQQKNALEIARNMLACVLILALLVLLRHWNSDPLSSPAVNAEPAVLGGMKSSNAGFDSDSSGLHILSSRIALEPFRRYVFSADIAAMPAVGSDLKVDLYNGGYDNPAQERQFEIGPRVSKGHLQGSFNSGFNSPDSAEFRMFYSGAPGLRLLNVHVSRLPIWRFVLENLFVLAMLALLARFLVSVMRWGQAQDANPTAAQSKTGVTWLVLAAIFLVATVLRWVLSNALPYWTGDEFVYKALASGIWENGHAGIPEPGQILHATNLPNMLYPYVIAPAFLLGEDFYTGIRLLNALIITSAIVPIYWIARRFVSNRMAFIMAVIGVFVPSAFLATYAVTEVLYFPLFIYCCLAALRAIEERDSWVRSLTFGVLVGVLMNVRLNGVVLLPAFMLVSLAIPFLEHRYQQPPKRSMAWLAAPIIAILTSIVLKEALAQPNTGALGIYENHSGGWLSTAVRVAASDPMGLAFLLLGHLTILAIPLSLGLATGLRMISMQPEGRPAIFRRRGAMFVILACLGSVALSIWFTLGVSPIDLNGLGRWHSRYYFSIFPLLLILCVTAIDGFRPNRLSEFAYWTTLLLHMLGALAFVFVYHQNSTPWFGSTVDRMEVHWYRDWYRLLPVLVIGQLTVAALSTARRNTVGIFLLIVSWILLANIGTWNQLRKLPSRHDPHCGSVMNQIVRGKPGAVAVAVGSRERLVDNVFWMSALPKESRMLEPGTKIDATSFTGVRYVLADESVTIENATPVPETGACKVYEVIK